MNRRFERSEEASHALTELRREPRRGTEQEFLDAPLDADRFQSPTRELVPDGMLGQFGPEPRDGVVEGHRALRDIVRNARVKFRAQLDALELVLDTRGRDAGQARAEDARVPERVGLCERGSERAGQSRDMAPDVECRDPLVRLVLDVRVDGTPLRVQARKETEEARKLVKETRRGGDVLLNRLGRDEVLEVAEELEEALLLRRDGPSERELGPGPIRREDETGRFAHVRSDLRREQCIEDLEHAREEVVLRYEEEGD